MSLRFIQPLYLILLLLIPLILFSFWRIQTKKPLPREKLFLVLRSLVLLLLILSLASLSLSRSIEQVNLIVLLDVSDSIGAVNQEKAKEIINNTLKHMKVEDTVGLVVFGGDASVDIAPQGGLQNLHISSEVSTNATDIAGAIQLALAAFPEKGANRLLLLSDGNENLGRALDMAANARGLGVEIYALPLIPDITALEVYVKEIIAPQRVKAGERHEIRVILHSNEAVPARLTFLKDGAYIGEDEVFLTAGENSFTYINSFDERGLHRYEVILYSQGDSSLENNRGEIFVNATGKPSILYVSQLNQVSEALIRALQAQDINLSLAALTDLPESLSGFIKYDGIIFDNVAGFDLSLSRMELIESYIRDVGGGFLMIGGENSFGVGGYYKTPIEQALPVDMDPTSRLSNLDLSLVMVVDKSGSMEGSVMGEETKLDLVKAAASSVVELLNPSDKVGLLAFDADFEWTVPITDAVNRDRIMGELSTLSPGGGTDLYNALNEGYRVINSIPLATRHIIILSDGLTSQGDFDYLSRKIAGDQITISTVAVGKDANIELMRLIAELGEGRIYITDRPENVPRIFITETMLVSRGLVVEDNFLPVIRSFSDIIGGIDLYSIPLLRGFVRTYLKPKAEEILSAADGNPLLAVWRYGLGRSGVFTSDLKAKWGSYWVQWEDYPRFVAQLIRWLERGDSPQKINLDIALHSGKAHITADALDEEDNFINFLELKTRIIKPGRVIAELDLEQTAPGRYSGCFNIQNIGKYFITLSGGNSLIDIRPRTFGLALPYSPEYVDFEVNLPMLEDIAELTGGYIFEDDQDLAELFQADPGKAKSFESIWLPLLLCSFILFLIDIAVRTLPFPGGLAAKISRKLASFPFIKEAKKVDKQREPDFKEMEEIMERQKNEEEKRIREQISGSFARGSFDADLAARLYLARLRSKRKREGD